MNIKMFGSQILFYFMYFLKDFIYLFFREGKGGRKRGRETSMCGCLSCAHTGDLVLNELKASFKKAFSSIYV